jgi:hypothetical protein
MCTISWGIQRSDRYSTPKGTGDIFRTHRTSLNLISLLASQLLSGLPISLLLSSFPSNSVSVRTYFLFSVVSPK